MEQLPRPEKAVAFGATPLPSPRAELREPSTAAALWPTFMRRTLTEQALRATAPKEPRASS